MQQNGTSATSTRTSAVVIGAVLEIRRDRITPDPNQPRTWFDEKELSELAMSIASTGQKVAIFVTPVPGSTELFTIVDGERRWRACGMVEVKKLKAIVITGSELELFKQSAITNFGRVGHTALETMNAVVRMKKLTGESDEKVAQYFGKSTAWVRNFLGLARLGPEIHALMEPSRKKSERLKVSVALQLIPLSRMEQASFAKDFAKNATSAKRAKHNIQHHRLTSGTATKLRVRTDHTSAKVNNFATRVEEDSELIVLMGQDQIADAFKQAGLRRTNATIENLVNAQGNIQKIVELLEQVRDGFGK